MKKIILLVICLLSTGSLCWAQATAPPLGGSASFAVLGHTTVTNTGATSITGNLGVSPGTAVTGFPPGTLTGTLHVGSDPVALLAHADATTAYALLVLETCGTNLTGQDLGGMTLTPGVYCFNTSAALTGQLTLSGNGVYVFQIGSTLTTGSGGGSSVVLTNGALCGNVFWQVGSSATLGTGTKFAGNLIAFTSDTVTTGVSVAGRVFALGAAVTLDTNVITIGACASSGGGGGGTGCKNDDDDRDKDHDRDKDKDKDKDRHDKDKDHRDDDDH